VSALAHGELSGMMRAFLVAGLVYQLDQLTVLGPASLVAIGTVSLVILTALACWVRRADSESKS